MVRFFAFFLLAQNFAVNGVELKDMNGKTRKPLNSNGYKAAVLFFITHDCPVANKMAPEINRIVKKYAKEIKFTLVYTDPEMTRAEALELRRNNFSLKNFAAAIHSEHK